MTESYYVRNQGRTLGPYGFEELRQRIQRGQVGRSHEISRDGESWQPAVIFGELFDQENRSDRLTGMNALQWHYTAKGIEQPGPIDHQSLVNLIVAGQVGAIDQVRNDPMAEWAVVCHVPELAGHIPPPTGAVSPVRRSPVEWWLQGWRNFANFEGRACRREFWYFVLFNGIVGCVAALLDLGFRTIDFDSGVGLFQTINAAAALVPSSAVTARRLHDTNRSGWFQLLVFVPLVGGIVLLIWLAAAGDAHDNGYGPDPKRQGVGGPQA